MTTWENLTKVNCITSVSCIRRKKFLSTRNSKAKEMTPTSHLTFLHLYHLYPALPVSLPLPLSPHKSLKHPCFSSFSSSSPSFSSSSSSQSIIKITPTFLSFQRGQFPEDVPHSLADFCLRVPVFRHPSLRGASQPTKLRSKYRAHLSLSNQRTGSAWLFVES